MRQGSAFPSPGGTKERGRGVVEAAPYCSPVPVSGPSGGGGGMEGGLSVGDE